MPLADLIGQPSAVRLLARLVARRRLPHAILFEGPAGCGRRTLAIALAASLLCEAPADGDACGTCASCRLVGQGTHPDLVQLPHDSAAVDYTIDLLRDQVVGPCGESALLGRGRVFVLPGIERMAPTTANVLLKVLEEPPAGVYFVMTTTQSAMVLKTIRSRVQLIRLQPLDAVAVEAVLRRGGMTQPVAALRAAQSTGGHRGLRDAEIAEPPLDDLLALLRDGYDSRRIADVVAQLPHEERGEESGRTLAAEQRLICRQWLMALCQRLRGELLGAEPELTCERIDRIMSAVKDLQRNLNPRLVIEALAMGGRI